MASNQKDLESGLGGLPHSDTIAVDTPAGALSPAVHRLTAESEANPALSRFRLLLGIIHNPELAGDRRPTDNKGIYGRVVKSERAYCKQYKIYATTINSVLGLQVIIAAALTSLGASNGSHTAVTALGAINTICAAFLTYLKGSGLPNRLKYFENEWCKVRTYIEQRERYFYKNHDWSSDMIDQEVLTIERMYETVKKDIEINQPDAYISVGSHATNGIRVDPPPSIANELRARAPEVENKLRGAPQTIEHSVGDARHDMEKRATETVHDAEKRATETVHDVEKRVNDTAQGVEHRVKESRVKDDRDRRESGREGTALVEGQERAGS